MNTEIFLYDEQGHLRYTISEGGWANATRDNYYGIWIKKDDGEGALFPMKKLLKCLDKFYSDNF